MYNKTLTTFLIAISLSSCAITGPDYEPPHVDMPVSFKETTQLTVTAQQNVTWWRDFKDPVLDALIQKSVQENKDVLQSIARINQSRALARAAFTELLPGARLSGSYERGQASTARFPGGEPSSSTSTPTSSGSLGNFDYEVYTASVDASWELDLFGRLQRELEARNAEYNASVGDVYDVVLVTISEVGNSYLSLRSVQEQLEIAKKNEKLQKELRDLTATKFQFGQVSELDVTRANTQLAQTRSLIPGLKALEKTHIHRLAVLIGEQPQTLHNELMQHAVLPDYKGPISIPAPEELLRRRPDLRRAERQLAANHARIGVAMGELYPKVTFTGSIGYQASKFSNLSDGEIYNFGPAISWAAFDSGRLRAQVDVAEARTAESLLAFEQAVLRALEDVENSLSTYRAQQLTMIELKKAFKAARKSYRLAKLQYNEGALDFLSVLDTQRVLLETENAYIQSKEKLSLALVSIYKSLGGGWQAWELSDDNSIVPRANS